MKTKITLIIIVALSLWANGQTKSKKYKDVFDLNSVKADQEHYSQAILQFQLLEKCISKYGKIYHLSSTNKPELYIKRMGVDYKDLNKFDIDNGVTSMVLFPNLEEINNPNVAEYNSLISKGVQRCQYDIPKELADLDSGFQFNHYIFKSSNNAALDAFGIVKSGFESESLYIVIDYLQRKDFVCTGLPKIRYAVGIRTEIKIIDWSNNTSLKETSLAGLAANAEINSLKVNITVKTIGITGLESKLKIPNNTNFNVETYSDYQKIIDFIRTFNDRKDGKLIDSIVCKPQLIPVMDEYKTTPSESFETYYESLKFLDKKLKKLYSKRNRYTFDSTKPSTIEKARAKIYASQIKAVEDELKILEDKKTNLSDADIYNFDLKRYVDLLIIINKDNGIDANTLLFEAQDSIKTNLDERYLTYSKKEKLGSEILKINEDAKKSSFSFEQARDFSFEAYQCIINKNISESIKQLEKAENLYPSLYNNYEILTLLKKQDRSNPNWKSIYKDILEKYSWKLPLDVINKLKVN